MNPSPVISILMPVYNEAPTIERAVNQVMAADLAEPYELIVVDDGSTDGTAEILTARDWPSQVTLLRHEVNRGKGAAVRTALSRARGEIATIFDADLEYDPDDLDDLIAPIKRGDTNAAFGVRAFAGHTSHSFLFVLGNRAVTLLANLLFNLYLRDRGAGELSGPFYRRAQEAHRNRWLSRSRDAPPLQRWRLECRSLGEPACTSPA
jgi:glycosyltransferase involved in cell wall biosynthesis